MASSTENSPARINRGLGIALLILALAVAALATFTFLSASAWYGYLGGGLFSVLALVLILRGVEHIAQR